MKQSTVTGVLDAHGRALAMHMLMSLYTLGEHMHYVIVYYVHACVKIMYTYIIMEQRTCLGVLDAHKHALALYMLISLHTVARKYAVCDNL